MKQLPNAIYGLLDYAAYPIGMLAVAPTILRNLGVAQYGIWTVITSVVSLGSIVASGFGDALIQRVAHRRGSGSRAGVVRLVRAAMGIHLVLGLAMAALICGFAPVLADRLAAGDASLRGISLWSIEIAGFLTAIRAIETVCISTQRAFERYGAAVRISIAGRLASLAAATALATLGRDVANIVAATAGMAGIALVFQLVRLQQLLETGNVAPSFDPETTKDLLGFGVYTWLLAAAGVVFSQADRLIGGASMGAAAVVAYALCAQISQPVYGLTAAGLHFVFPYLARSHAGDDQVAPGRILVIALAANILLVIVGAGLLFALSNRIFHVLATDAIARACAPLVGPVLASSALLALSVTGSYGMVALGRVKTVAIINVAGAVAIALVIALFMTQFGVMAVIGGRLAFAAMAMLVYIPLIHELRLGIFNIRRNIGNDVLRKTVAEEA